MEPNPDVVAIVMPPEVEEECKIIGVEFAGMKIRLTPVQKIQRKFEKVRQTGQELLWLTFDEPDAQDGQTDVLQLWSMPAILLQSLRGFEPHDGWWITGVFVGVDYARRRMVLSAQGFGEKALSRSCV